ncbi:MAG: site-2 protease family protein [Patescibacteria group bacterium]
MLNLLFTNPLVFLIFAVGLVIAITIHEFSHAWVADHLGDPTPRVQGRLTLNPLSHLDPLGTVALLMIGFGWGKPVEFDPYNLQNRTRDAALIALAGPTSNLILAVIASLLIRFVFPASDLIGLALVQLVIINITLAIFNLIPVAPLDGEKILYAFLPKATAIDYQIFMRKNGLFVLLLLMLPIFNGVSPVSRLISPAIEYVTSLLLAGI